jgi:hypothetical protein
VKGKHMTYKLRGLWSITAVAAISIALATGTLANKNAYAEDGTQTEDHSTMSEMEHKTAEADQKAKAAALEARTKRVEAERKAQEARKAVGEKVESKTQERKDVVREKLSADKLKACEKRQANINDHTERIADRGTKHLALLTKITDRVKAFYVTKGNTLANYDTLVADVDAKKAAAEAAVQSISSSTANFICSDGNPKQSVEGFKTNLTARQTALKNYQVAVKNLIVGVKSVNSTTTSTNKENR